MKQSSRKPADAIPRHAFEFQVDAVHAHALGGRSTLVAPDGLAE